MTGSDMIILSLLHSTKECGIRLSWQWKETDLLTEDGWVIVQTIL
jgi:hypothetical protein